MRKRIETVFEVCDFDTLESIENWIINNVSVPECHPVTFIIEWEEDDEDSRTDE